jgi:ankyrin repeat protein
MTAADSWAEVVSAFHANDAAGVMRALDRNPELTKRLNDPIPGGAFGATPLLAAVQRGSIEMVDVLLRAGADINQRSHWWAGGFGVLDDDHGLAPLLIERGAVVNVHAAARLGIRERLAELVEADPKLVHARGGDGQTPLHVARSVEIAAYLVEHGADINALDVDHESTPAQYLVRSHQDVTRYLVGRGCRTDILMAAALGDLDLVRRHIAEDPASIYVSVADEHFPMRDPRAGGSIYTWTLGANKSAHQVARDFGHEHVFRALMLASPDVLKLAEACEAGDEELVRELLARSPELPRTLPERERRRLVTAAERNNTDSVRRLLAAGWPADARGNHGASALHFAAWLGNLTMVREVLRFHPSLERADDEFGLSPLGWALHGSEHSWNRANGDYPGTVEALLLAGARPPLSTGRVRGTPAVVDVLGRHSSGRGADSR